MLDPKALTKIQSIILIAIVVVAAVGGAVYYLLAPGNEQSADTIKIGLCVDIGTFMGDKLRQGALLAAEQVNAEGGVLGREFEIVVEDDDIASADMQFASSALTRLMTADEADLILSIAGPVFSSLYQEKAAEFQKILFNYGDSSDALTQKVLDDYDKYNYFFRFGLNNSIITETLVDSFIACREYTGFNKVAILAHDLGIGELVYSSYVAGLEDYNFDVVYTSLTPYSTIDFSSFFAQAEAAGAEIFYPMVIGQAATIPFIKEYYDRQSPMIIWGSYGIWSNFWELTEGKCDSITAAGHALTVGYPMSSKVIPTREAYFERWGEEIEICAAFGYDVVRFILPEAIEQAGTIETEAVIAALENMEIETSLAKKIAFTPSHDPMVITTGDDYWVHCLFQWQNGERVPIYPKSIKEAAGASYTFPDWPGPWDNID